MLYEKKASTDPETARLGLASGVACWACARGTLESAENSRTAPIAAALTFTSIVDPKLGRGRRARCEDGARGRKGGIKTLSGRQRNRNNGAVGEIR